MPKMENMSYNYVYSYIFIAPFITYDECLLYGQP